MCEMKSIEDSPLSIQLSVKRSVEQLLLVSEDVSSSANV